MAEETLGIKVYAEDHFGNRKITFFGYSGSDIGVIVRGV